MYLRGDSYYCGSSSDSDGDDDNSSGLLRGCIPCHLARKRLRAAADALRQRRVSWSSARDHRYRQLHEAAWSAA